MTPPTVTTRAHDGGWLTSCECGWESWTQRRPAADLAAWEHVRMHGRNER